MMGEVPAQGNLFSGDYQHLDYVGRTTFYGWLGTDGARLYPDEDFRSFYVLDNGRPSVAPSRMIRMVLLQWHDKVSDDEAVERTKYDLRWKTALGIEDHEGLCAKFTLQTFRGKLLLNERGRAILRRSAKACRKAGVLRSRKIRASVDTSPIIGRGAVKDTYNLVADGMAKLLGALAAFETPLLESVDVNGYAGKHDFSRYFGDVSLKGAAALDWDSESERVAFLTELVVDVRRALGLARSLLAADAPGGPRCGSPADVRAAMQLLEQLVDQDIEVRDDQAHIKQGVAPNRIVSVHDPEMRHGRKSKRTRFDGHKGEIVVDTDSGVIMDASVKAGNAHDADGSLGAIERAEQTVRDAWADAPAEVAADAPAEETAAAPVEETAAVPVEEVAHAQVQSEAGVAQTLGDCAYGTAANRRAFLDASRELIAKQPALHNGGRFTKEDFARNADTGARTCPAGHTLTPRLRTVSWQGETRQVPFYRWPAALCSRCPRKEQCLAPSKSADTAHRHGRTVSEHPEEELLAQARAQQHTPDFHAAYRERQTVEHRLARMMQLGSRQARYFGRAKTELQWLLAATVANLTLVAGLQKGEKAACGVRTSLKRLLNAIRLAIRNGCSWATAKPARSTFTRRAAYLSMVVFGKQPFWPDF